VRRRALRIAALVALAVLVGVAGYLAAVRPQQTHARRLQQRIGEAQAQLLALEQIRSSAAAASPTELYQLARAMPIADDLPDVLLDLDRAATAAHVQLVSVRPSPDTTLADGSKAVPLTVVVGGSYAHATAFLRAIRATVRRGPGGIVATGRLFGVDGVQLTLGDGNAVVATLQMNAFVYAPPAATTDATATAAATTTTASTPAPGAEAVGTP
jgi:Tfp pilus assembly protein PilO